MPESYFSLSNEDKAALVKLRAPEVGMVAFLVEKDIWVCWALEQLFKMPDALPMAFKGGTSLSKVFAAIDRFSEDIDVTIDYRGFGVTLTGSESRGEIERLSEKLKASVLKYTSEKVKPYFEKILTEQFGAEPPQHFPWQESLILYASQILVQPQESSLPFSNGAMP